MLPEADWTPKSARDSTGVEVYKEEGRRIHPTLARQAYRDFGKGSAHPVTLNFGDCFAYALNKAKREPLLFKGDDFPHTDINSVLALGPGRHEV